LQKEQSSVINTVHRQWKNLSAVSLTPVNIMLPVSLTPAITFFPGFIDTNRYNQKAKNLLRVSTTSLKNWLTVSPTLPINFSAVSTTPAIRESCQY
jgi:hypothetical protein